MALVQRLALARQALDQGLAPLPMVLKALEIPRSSWYYHQKVKPRVKERRKEEEEKAKALLHQILLEHPGYGYRRIVVELRGKGVRMNGKRVLRLLRASDLALSRAVKPRKPNPLVEIVRRAGPRADLRALVLRKGEVGPLELVYLDFTLIPYAEGLAWFLPVLDHRTRMVLAWGLGPSPSAELALEVWGRAREAMRRLGGREPVGVVVHQDQGGAFLSHEWVGRLLREGQRLSYSLRGAKGNPVVESFFSRFKGENGDLFVEARALEELKGVIEERLRYYGERRLHSGLGYLTPGEALRQALGGLTPGGGKSVQS